MVRLFLGRDIAEVTSGHVFCRGVYPGEDRGDAGKHRPVYLQLVFANVLKLGAALEAGSRFFALVHANIPLRDKDEEREDRRARGSRGGGDYSSDSD